MTYKITNVEGGKTNISTKIGFLYLYNDFVPPQMCVCVCTKYVYIRYKEGTKTA